MYPYTAKPGQTWGLGAILITLLVVVGIAALVLSPGDAGFSTGGSPKGTLASGDETQAGCTGSNGCPEPGGDINVYKLNMPIPQDAMTVAEGSTMIFDYGGESGEGFPYCDISSLDSNAGGALNCKWKGEYIEVPTDLPPSEYGLALSITSEAGDDADFYGFHLLVE